LRFLDCGINSKAERGGEEKEGLETQSQQMRLLCDGLCTAVTDSELRLSMATRWRDDGVVDSSFGLLVMFPSYYDDDDDDDVVDVIASHAPSARRRPPYTVYPEIYRVVQKSNPSSFLS